ncbi:ctr copper transporter family protein [Venturia nashicola]|uniref:Copper transport protein n=1 Tax=Venturia nashicola TaxID=86259 RepID=A0A4Z1NKI6_9PEZI|nr:ctr copper transporter family protein [Venturia nashicola]
MSMSKPMSSVTTTSTAASATSTGMVMDHSGMDHSSMSMGGAKACKISMTWNWFTIDSCVVLMVILLEALRRSSKEYDALILREHMSKSQQSQSNTSVVTNDGTETEPTNNNSSDREKKGSTAALLRRFSQPNATAASFRPNLLQQGIRAFLHMLQFALAYFIMLMAMYYNGYIIISIFIGAYIGAFIFSWQSIGIVRTDNGIDANETTYCCG